MLDLQIGDKLTMRPKDTPGVPFDSDKRKTIEALREVSERLLNDKDHGAAVRHYKSVSEILREIESGSMAGYDPRLAARAELEKAREWLPVNELARRLHAQDVQSPGTRNEKSRSEGKLRKRRPFSNIERLERLFLQDVNYNRLSGCKRIEGNMEVTLVGLVGWKLPEGARRMEARPKKSKKRK